MADIFAMADTWNASGTQFSAIQMDVTNTDSAAGSMLSDLRLDGDKYWSVTKDLGVLLYNTWTDDSNYERAAIYWSSNKLWIETQDAGTGAGRSLNILSARDLSLASGGGFQIKFLTGGTVLKWEIANNGEFVDKSGNFIELKERSAPGVGGSNTARLYAVDNGSGKTQLMVIFASGSPIELAIEV